MYAVLVFAYLYIICLIQEFDSPLALLEKEDSFLRTLVDRTGAAAAKKLWSLATNVSTNGVLLTSLFSGIIIYIPIIPFRLRLLTISRNNEK